MTPDRKKTGVPRYRPSSRTWSIRQPDKENLKSQPRFCEKALTGVGKAFAAGAVNDLRPLRGALPRVIDILLASAGTSAMGAWPLPTLEKKPNLKRRRNVVLI